MLWYELNFITIKLNSSTICFCILFMTFLRKKQIPLAIKCLEKRQAQLIFPAKIVVFRFDREDKQNLSQRTISIWGQSVVGSLGSIKNTLGTLICFA